MATEQSKYRRFYHKRKPHLDLGGCYISLSEYQNLKSLNINDTAIKMDHARDNKDLIVIHEDEAKKERTQYPKIETLAELSDYIGDIIGRDVYEKLKVQAKGKTVDEAIELFPWPFDSILRMFKSQKERRTRDKQRELDSLNETLIDNVEFV